MSAAGTEENSPAFQGWVGDDSGLVLLGRREVISWGMREPRLAQLGDERGPSSENRQD
jgi:hypothetical protein